MWLTESLKELKTLLPVTWLPCSGDTCHLKKCQEGRGENYIWPIKCRWPSKGTYWHKGLQVHRVCSHCPKILLHFLSFLSALLKSWMHWKEPNSRSAGSEMCFIPHVWTQFQNESLPVERNSGKLYSSVCVQMKEDGLREFGITRWIFPC